MRAVEARKSEAGYTLAELMVAMVVTLVLTGLAGKFLEGAFNVRLREDERSVALADAQRALNIMSREIANSGFGLANNGIVAADSNAGSIRLRANLNAFDGVESSSKVSDSQEDVRYRLISTSTNSYIERLDVNTGSKVAVLSNRVDDFTIAYFSDRVDYETDDCEITADDDEVTDKKKTKYVVIAVCVDLPARGAPGSTGYQPPSAVQLTSAVALRNANLTKY
ncbi:MAG TPA: prepilin-type N-terminal cleavage/methylation domain-containing protein [Pyrinomonadaceae bacterium]|jgi:type II secretory pathway component PulJ